MVSKLESIEKWIEVLNDLVVGLVLMDDFLILLIIRDGFFDVLFVLYEECSYEYFIIKNKYVVVFVRKCKNVYWLYFKFCLFMLIFEFFCFKKWCDLFMFILLIVYVRIIFFLNLNWY